MVATRTESRRVGELASLVTTFVIANAVCLVTPPLLKYPFHIFFPLMKWGDAFDLLSPVILSPLYYAMFMHAHAAASRKAVLVFVAVLGLYAQAFGIHLSANSTGHIIKDHGALHGSDVHSVNDFYDEWLSHVLGHLALILLTTLLYVRHAAEASVDHLRADAPALARIRRAGIAHGVTCFVFTVESGTYWMGFPWMIALQLIAGMRARPPLHHFFLAHTRTTLLMLVAWGLYFWPLFPEFSDLRKF